MLLKNIREDLNAHKSKFRTDSHYVEINSSMFVSFLNPCFAIVFYYRLYSWLYVSKSKFLKKVSIFIYYFASRRYSCDIHPAASIGVPLKIGHCSDIVIGPDAVIGKNCYIFNGVTVGNKNIGGLDNSMPNIGDNVLLSTGAKVLGPCVVGPNSIVGALTLVNKNIPEYSTVVGIPGRIISSVAK